MPKSPPSNRRSARPRILDLFCCEGGAAQGYADAGWEVVGVDIEPQPRYPFEFIHADALALSRDALRGCWHESSAVSVLPGMLNRCLGHFDAVHTAPPCQAHSDLQKQSKRDYPDFIEPTRTMLERWGLPYVIENVDGAPLRDPITLCGTMFPELRVIRHRLFETNWPLAQPVHPKARHPLVFTHDKRKAHYGKLDQDTSYVQVTGGGNCTIANKRDAMGTPWMSGHGCNEATPPAYTRWIGERLMEHVIVERLELADAA